MVVVIVQWSSHPTSDQGDVGSNPAQGNYSFPQKLSTVEFPVTFSLSIAGVLKTRSNSAAKSKLTASFKFLGGAASWLVACKSNKYEVIVHGQKNSIYLFMGG